jgi:hypothetical protein
MSKEDAQRAYDEAYAAHQDSYQQLMAARKELDRYLLEEEAQRAAVFMFGPGADEDERLVQAAKEAAENRQRMLEAQGQGFASEDDDGASDGPIGGLA